MGHWTVSIPVGSMSELELTLKYTKNIDLSGFFFYKSLGMDTQGSPDKLIECLYPFRHYIHSMHMFNDYATIGRNGRLIIEYNIEIMRVLEIPCGMLHLRTYRSEADIAGELSFLTTYMKADSVIALENLPDSSDKGEGSTWVRVPDKIASYSKSNHLQQFGLCLDTSHALCRNELEWETPAIRDCVMAIHLSESRIGYDDHESLAKCRNQSLVETVCRIMKSSERDGVVVLEQSSHASSLESLKYLRERIGQNSNWLEL